MKNEEENDTRKHVNSSSGGATGGLLGIYSPTSRKGQFCNLLKFDEKMLGGGGGEGPLPRCRNGNQIALWQPNRFVIFGLGPKIPPMADG